MRKLLLLAIILFGIAPSFGAVQTPAIQIAFTCNLSAAKCNEFLRLAADGLGCPPGTNAARLLCVQTKEANRVIKIALDQKKGEDSNAAINAAETTFRVDFPDQP